MFRCHDATNKNVIIVVDKAVPTALINHLPTMVEIIDCGTRTFKAFIAAIFFNVSHHLMLKTRNTQSQVAVSLPSNKRKTFQIFSEKTRLKVVFTTT